jgi:hypothetical protein
MTSTHSKTFCLWLINWLKQDHKNDHNAFCFLDDPAFFSTLDKFLRALSGHCFKHIEAVQVLYAAILLKRWVLHLSRQPHPLGPEELAAYFALCLWISHALWADDVYTHHAWMLFFNQDPRTFANLSTSLYPEIPCWVKKRDTLLKQLWENQLLHYTQDYPLEKNPSFYEAYQTLWVSKCTHRRFNKTIKNGVYISLILISLSAIGLSLFWSHPLLFGLGVACLICFGGLLTETAFFHRHPQQR